MCCAFCEITFSNCTRRQAMAPREATGTFPDQFLTFDYDASIPMGLPPQHEPMPVTHEGDPEDLGPIAEEALNHVGTGTHSGTDPARISGSAPSPIDPLSIDPTMDEDSPWSNNDSEPSQQPSSPDTVPSTDSAAFSAGRRHFSSVSSVERNGNSSMDLGNNVQASSPISTGSSLLNAPSVPSTPDSHPSSPITNGMSLANQRLRSRTLQMLSVLDTSVLSDSGDSSFMAPRLERTFDSSASSAPDPAEWEENAMMTEVVQSPTQQPEHDFSSNLSVDSDDSSESMRHLYRNAAFDGEDPQSPVARADSNDEDEHPSTPMSPNSIMLSFGPNTTVSDLKYFAERGCIVALLQALKTPRLVTLGTRMLADYAKMSHRRVAVASNRRILEFVQKTMLVTSEDADWLGREYAVETVRSLTATEASDRYLMGTPGLLNTLALVARGGPFVNRVGDNEEDLHMPLASEKARLHACIAIMNLSCGKANKIEIAKIPEVLEAMRDVMLNSTEEARLKATTCVKNLSNADANDVALLGTNGLVEALGHVAHFSCSSQSGATPCTTNACLALMNLSIAKSNKHIVFRAPGVMEALMTVLERTTAQGSSNEARIKACSALSNLAIGYDNKIPMFNYPGFVDSILNVIQTDTGEARTKACSILWSFAAEMKNQVPVVQRGDILPVLVQVAEEDGTTEARFKCVAALTLLAESLDNAIPLLEAGALVPLMEILHDAGPDPTQWKGQTASWCVGFLMNIAQSDEAVPALREAGVVELLAPLLTLDHYQSLKAAMAVTFCCRYDKGDECYDLLRKTENVIPKIISLLHNTLSGRGGNGYKYGVFTLRSSVGCIAALALGPDFMKDRVATSPVFESLLQVITDFCVEGGTDGAIVGGGRDDTLSATLAIRALHSLTGHLIPIAGSSALPFGHSMENRLIVALRSFEKCPQSDIKNDSRSLATDARVRIEGGRKANLSMTCAAIRDDTDVDMGDVASSCCGIDYLPGFGQDFLHGLMLPALTKERPASTSIVSSSSLVMNDDFEDSAPVRTFLLADERTGRRFVVPTDPTGGRAFHDTRVWCYRRGRFCALDEDPDPNYVWTPELQQLYEAALEEQNQESVSDSVPMAIHSHSALV